MTHRTARTASLIRSLSIAGALSLVALAAAAQPAPGTPTEIALLRCLDIPADAARLACFDTQAKALREASAAGRVALVDRSPRDENFGQAAAAPAPEEIRTHIVGRFDGWDTNQRIKLANGQVWQILEEGTAISAHTDPKVVIRAGAMKASYFMTVEGRNAPVRVRRVQ